MAVQDGEYRMWAALARRHDLPEAAHAAVVDGLLPGKDPFEPSSWQCDVFTRTLPSLFTRVSDQGLRDRLIAAMPGEHVTGLVGKGVLRPDDFPGVLRHHQVTSQLIAALARQEAARELVLGRVRNLELRDLVTVALACELLDLEKLDQIPQVPDWLLDALVRRGLHLATDALKALGGGDQRGGKYARGAGWPSYEAFDMVLERCPDQWPALVDDRAHGQAMRHILLDRVATAKLNDRVLASCVPALCLPEWSALPERTDSHRERLRHIARRVAAHPRLREMAAAQLAEAVDQCVREGRLLHAARLELYESYELTSLANDLALTSGNAEHLAQLCAWVGRLPDPLAVERHAPDHDDELSSPKLLLTSDSRVGALAALAGNPHLDRSEVTGLLGRLHPVEVQWLLTYEQEVPPWLRQAAAEHMADRPKWEVPRVLSDTELDKCADPQALMQSWLDTIKDHRGCFHYQVEYAILASRHQTDALVRQLPAPIVLSHYEDPTAAETLLRTCGGDPVRWQAMVDVLAASRIDYSETFGQFMDRFHTGNNT
ncbi:hypothetical protein ACWC5C_32590 [Streptomyces sp. NPDC001700]